jgi:hypothetical protein
MKGYKFKGEKIPPVEPDFKATIEMSRRQLDWLVFEVVGKKMPEDCGGFSGIIYEDLKRLLKS